MWSAIKSDLLNFVTTIQEDTTKTISKVLGDEEEDEDGSAIQEKIAADVRRSFETYGTSVKESNVKEFNRFKKTFSLGQYANDIGFVLDEEPEVSRFYAELVPAQISPEEFWARLFFRLNKVYRSTSVNGTLDDDDEEEELVWDAHDDNVDNETPENKPIVALASNGSLTSLKNAPSGNIIDCEEEISDSTALSVALRRVAELEVENNRMKGQIRSLVGRVSELETALQTSTSAMHASTSLASVSSDSQSVNTFSANESSVVVDTVIQPTHIESVSDIVSQSSRTSSDSSGSGVVVGSNTSDTMSFPDESSSHGLVNDNDSISVSATSAGGLSAQTSQFLPAVDDEDDDEENGWN